MYINQICGSVDKLHEFLKNVDPSDVLNINEVMYGQFSVLYNNRKREFLNTLKSTENKYLYEITFNDTDYSYDDGLPATYKDLRALLCAMKESNVTLEAKEVILK